MTDQTERLRQLKNELNNIKNSNLTDSQFLMQSVNKFGSKKDFNVEDNPLQNNSTFGEESARYVLTQTQKGLKNKNQDQANRLQQITQNVQQQNNLPQVLEQSQSTQSTNIRQKKKKLVEIIDSDSSSDKETQNDKINQHLKLNNEQFLIDQIMKQFNKTEGNKESESFIDKKLYHKQNEQKEALKKQLRILKYNMDRETDQVNEHIDSLKQKIVQSQLRKDHTQNMIGDLEQRQYTFEKDKLLNKNRLEQVNKDLQNIDFAQKQNNYKNEQLETIINMTIENQKSLRERNIQMTSMLQTQEQAHDEKEQVMKNQLNELKQVYMQLATVNNEQMQ